ncbi:hypothetical protein N4G70_00440 [Streptomyces sp. ASQP_92]|uniref:hypothetical protein n=1 Tax=Streptomyces TaxID=1883 RepID=UPI0021C01555|nr:hypothetical protein [Streptomyces sp. ASQP_92]MCT9087333.1 hypothetical protein [Streptomyces sp. ASQP_92]
MHTNTRPATLFTQVDGRNYRPEPISLDAARSGIRRARASRDAVDAVNVYATTDRDGTALHVAYIHHTPGRWSNVSEVIDVYEIPTDALTDL